MPEPGNPQSLNRYAYVLNNPLRHVDPSGHIPLDWIIDIAGVAFDAYMLWTEPSWENAGWLALDVVLWVVPYVPAAARPVAKGAKFAISHGDDAAKVIKAADKAADAERAVGRIRQIGQWVKRNESMSDAARAYQRFISGRADDLVFKVGEYTFDYFDEARNVLMDAKAIPDNFIDPVTRQFKPWVSGTGDWVKQAENQVKAAGGVRIEWYFSSEAAREAMYKLLLAENPKLLESIELIYKLMP